MHGPRGSGDRLPPRRPRLRQLRFGVDLRRRLLGLGLGLGSVFGFGLGLGLEF